MDFEIEGKADTALVAIGGKLPNQFRVTSGKLLDIMMALAPRCRGLEGKQRQKVRKSLQQKLYNQTRPGFYCEVAPVLHFSYAGQPGGAKTLHHWYIFCADQLKPQIEILVAGTALVASAPSSENGASGNYTREWGGLYLRSEAEVRIAEALDKAGVLFFANARGRVGLQDTLVSDTQLTGRVEVDFMVFYQGRCVILEVDGGHHGEAGQTIRDYARDRVLLRSGVPTVRFVAQDCMTRPQAVVSEVLAILQQKV